MLEPMHVMTIPFIAKVQDIREGMLSNRSTMDTGQVEQLSYRT